MSNPTSTCPYCSSTIPTNAQSCPSCGANLIVGLRNGTFLFGGTYQIEKVISQGGFGITYLATQIKLQRQVTIKELFPQGCSHQNNTVRPHTQMASTWQQTVRSFLGEAQTLAQFHHTGIVSVVEFFEENNTAYYVMEFLIGQALSDYILKRGVLDANEAIRITLAVCDALKVVHGVNVLHRDIKPDNIFVESSGRVVLIDFGSARAFLQNQTMAHTQLISPGYAPFEQYTSSAKFGPYTDIYAIGGTLYTMLTGKIPAAAPDRAQGIPLAWTGNEPPYLRAVIERAMQVDTKYRPQTIDEFRQVVTQSAPAIPQRPPPPVVPISPRAQGTPRSYPVQQPGPYPVQQPGPYPVQQPGPYPVRQPGSYPLRQHQPNVVGCFFAAGCGIFVLFIFIVIIVIIVQQPSSYSPPA
jgi:serine/threonine protein kinase